MVYNEASPEMEFGWRAAVVLSVRWLLDRWSENGSSCSDWRSWYSFLWAPVYDGSYVTA